MRRIRRIGLSLIASVGTGGMTAGLEFWPDRDIFEGLICFLICNCTTLALPIVLGIAYAIRPRRRRKRLESS